MDVDILTSLNKNGSGLNLRELSTSLAQADVTPRINRLTTKVEATELSISALGEVRAKLASLSTSVQLIRANPILSARSGNSGVAVSITDQSKIATRDFTFGVEQLAKRQVLEFTGFNSADALVGAGTLQVEIGTWSEDVNGDPVFALNPETTVRTLTIPTGVTLSMLAETLNALPGMSAQVQNKGDGTFSLGVVSEEGAAQALRFTATETAPGLAAFDTNTTNATRQIQAAQNALLKVDGITVSRPSNTISDLIPGAELQISAAAGTETTVSFSRDIEAAKLSMEAMIEELNATRKLLDDLSARGVGGAEAGALAGDRLVEKLKSDLTKMLSQPIEGFGSSAKRLLDFGVATNRDGTLRLDVTRFERAFASDPASFDMLFNDRLSSNVEGLTVGGALGPAARPGVYNFVRDAGTGVATLDDTQMLGLSVSPGSRRFVLFQGNLSGIQLDVPDGVDEAEVRYGRSFLSSLESLLDTALSSGANSLSERETQLTERLTDTTTQIEELEARQVTLEQRYLSRFTAMETAIAGLRSTGAYLTNLVAQWNKST